MYLHCCLYGVLYDMFDVILYIGLSESQMGVPKWAPATTSGIRTGVLEDQQQGEPAQSWASFLLGLVYVSSVAGDHSFDLVSQSVVAMPWHARSLAWRRREMCSTFCFFGVFARSSGVNY